MKLPFIQKKFQWNYLHLSFLLPMGLMLVLMFVTSVMPFGGRSFLYSDNYHQYYPFFRQFRESLRSGDSLLWSWSVGMGMDYLGLISYYLASPLYLLSVLLPESLVLPYFTMLMPIKLTLASGFFALMLKKLFDTDDFSLPLFGCFYGMCAWALGYQWNIMWLDTFALLPLTALGTVMLLRDKKYILYTVTLFLSMYSNYYVGFFVCIFIFLLFFCYQICRWAGLRRFVQDFFRIGVFTLLALGMTLILLLPALAALQDTYSSINQFPSGFSLNMADEEVKSLAVTAWNTLKSARKSGTATTAMWIKAIRLSIPPVFDAMRQVAGQIGGGHTPTFMDGLPNLYCGVFPIALGFLFLMSKEVKLRDKLCCVGLLTFFICSFIFRQLDYIWHGFHFTNQIPYRFSFLFSFVVLYMAYRAWLLRDNFSLTQLGIAAVLSLGLLMLSGNWGDLLYWLFNLAFLAVYFLFMLYSHPRFARQKKGEVILILEESVAENIPLPEDVVTEEATTAEEGAVNEAAAEVAEEDAPLPAPVTASRYPSLPVRRRQASIAVAVAMTVELVLNLLLFASGFSIYDYDYPLKEKDAASMFAVVKELEEDSNQFYRMEVTHAQTLNDGALNSYNGVSAFTSSANVATTRFMVNLGMAAQDSWNRYCYEDSSPVANLFLNLKYLMERERPTEGNAYFDVKHTYKGITLLENNAWLPLGFLAEPELAELKFGSSSRTFLFQNQLFKAATGVRSKVWRDLGKDQLTVTGDEDVQIDRVSSGYTSFSTGTTGGQLTYTYTAPEAGFLCLDVNLYQQDSFSVMVNDELVYHENYSLPQILAVGDVQADDEVTLRVMCKPNLSNTSVTVKAAVLNEERFRQGYDVLSASTLQLTEFSNNEISGTINCNRDGLMYTSVPQDGNWKAFVDGQEAEILLVGDCMISLMLEEGVHQVEFRYENQALRYGAMISAACAGIFGIIVLIDHLRKKKKA